MKLVPQKLSPTGVEPLHTVHILPDMIVFTRIVRAFWSGSGVCFEIPLGYSRQQLESGPSMAELTLFAPIVHLTNSASPGGNAGKTNKFCFGAHGEAGVVSNKDRDSWWIKSKI